MRHLNGKNWKSKAKLPDGGAGVLHLVDIDVDVDVDVDDVDDVDIYILMQFCLSVTKNHHFLLGASCDHLNYPKPPSTTPG